MIRPHRPLRFASPPLLFRRSALAATLCITLGAAACSAPSAAGSAPSATPLARPSAAGSGTPTAGAADATGPFTCALPITQAGTASLAQITDLRVASHLGYDRIAFEFASGIPQFTLTVATPPFARDPSGLPLQVGGTAHLRLVLHGGTKVSPDGALTYAGPKQFAPGASRLVELVEAGDFEAVSSWLIGLRSASCVRVLTLSSPARLVIDLQH